MNRKQKIIVSITGIFIVLLALVGLTYAYFLTRIRGNTNDKSISVTTANLELVYGDDDGSIIGDGELIEPDTTFETKTFTVTNNGNSKIDNYAVILEDVKTYYATTFIDEDDNEIEAGTTVAFKRPQDFEITISCSGEITDPDTNEKEATTCSGYTGTLPLMESKTLDETYITNGILTTNSIEVGEKHTYSVVLKYKEANTDQSDDMNKVLDGKFNIIDANNTVDITGTVENATGVDAIVTNSTRRVSQINSDGSYKIVGLEADVHSIKKKIGTTETEIGKLSVVKGKEASVGETTYNGATIKQLTIIDASREATVDMNITSNTITIDEQIKSTLSQAIIANAKNEKNGTIYSATPLSKVGEEISGTGTGIYERVTESTDSLCSGYAPWCIGDSKEVARNCQESAKSYNDAENKYVYDQCDGWIKYLESYDSVNSTITFRTETEKVLSEAEDDFGISYFYRGAVEDNYVTFAGMCWRIVRIAGDVSVKIVLEDQDEACSTSMNGNWGIPTTTGGTTYTGNYGYELKNVDSDSSNEYIMSYLKPVTNADKSMARAFYDFQKDKLEDYKSKLKSGNWCLVDKAYTQSGSSPNYTYTLLEEYNYSSNMFYDSYVRLYGNSTKEPTLKCTGTIMDKFESVTYNETEIIEEAPMYVSALTADEMIYAGGKVYNGNNDSTNENFYLLNELFKSESAGYYSFSSLSPYSYNGNIDSLFGLGFSGRVSYHGATEDDAFRPTVSLASSSVITRGEGTLENPYVIG